MKYYSQSISKRESRVINEDAALAKKGMAAVSDGAGGGGVLTLAMRHPNLLHVK